MAYIGNIPAEAYTNTVKDSFNGDGSTVAFTMSLPSATNDVRVVVENVVQDPTVAYSCSGTTLTFTSAPVSGTANIYVVHLGAAVMTTIPPSEIADATTFASNVTVQGSFTSQGIDDNATSTAMTLDGSGNLLVGTTSAFGNTGITIDQSGQFFASRSSNPSVVADRRDSDGDAIHVRKNGTTVGSIGTASSGLVYYFSGPQNAVKIVGPAVGVDAFGPASTSGANRDNAMDLGWSSDRFKDLYLSGGVYLGGTGSANKLDDYEEGLWTPVIEGSSVAGVGSYAGQYGSYTKVGNMVTANCYVIASSHTGSGSQTKVAGFPFAVASGAYSYSAPCFGEITNVAKSNDTILGGYMIPSESKMLVTQLSTTTVGNTSNLSFDTSLAFLFTVTYRTA